MKKSNIISIVFLISIVFFGKTTAQVSNKKIIGKFFYSHGCCGDGFESNLTLDGNFNFKNKYLMSTWDVSWRGIITGTWSTKGDTVILNPLTIQRRGVKPITCILLTQFSDSLQPYSINFCKPDTLIYKDNLLLNTKGKKEYDRK